LNASKALRVETVGSLYDHTLKKDMSRASAVNVRVRKESARGADYLHKNQTSGITVERMMTTIRSAH
jgi:hypothetical protein